MESFGEAKSDPNPDSVGDAAANELARLAELEDSAWHGQNLKRAPALVMVGVVFGSIGMVAMLGIIFRDYGDTWQGLALGLLLCLGFIAGIIRLERRYSGARTPATFPPRRVFRKQWKLIVLIQVPMYFFIPIFVNGVESGASWQFFAGVMTAILAITILWMLALDKLGIVARVAPQTTATS